jgi:L-cysteine S-thiosulfotransferase
VSTRAVLHRMHAQRGATLAAIALTGCAVTTAGPAPDATYAIVGDAIPTPLTARPGDAEAGRRIVADPRAGLCLLCHSGPFPEVRFQGDVGGNLAGAGARWSEGQLRLRLVDPARVNPATVMPAFHRTEGLSRVGEAWRGRPVLQAQQIEDVVAFLHTLRTP